jgi:ADP-ribose pyrophosphatase YjhB (NUDIX family)
MNQVYFYIIPLVFDYKNRILGVRKILPLGFLDLFGIRNDFGSIWFAPVNIQNQGETREEAAERIVLQETGYKVKARYQVEKTLFFHFSKLYESFAKIVGVCDLIDNNVDPNFKKPDYIEDIKWFNKEELLENILPEISSKWPEPLKKVLGVSG